MSFSAEMKDFLSAAQTTTKILASKTDEDYKKAQTDATKQKTARENDPDTLALADQQARANLAHTQAATGLTQEQVKSAPVSRAYTGVITDRIRQSMQPQPTPGSGLLPTPMAPGVAPGGGTGVPAVGGPVLQNTMAPDTLNYAGGGAIPDGDGDDDEEGELATPTDPMTDVSARSRGGGGTGFVNQRGLEGVVSPQLVHDAVKGGYAYGMKQAGIGGGVRTPQHQAAAKAIAEGQGGLTQAELEAAKKAVDPEGKLTDSQRNMAALGSVYQFWANKGEPEKAQKVAFQMLQSYRNAATRYAAIAAHAAETGNIDLATKAAMKAYANVPDGRDMTMTVDPQGRILYHYTDDNGKTITKGMATPQELASSAMGLAKGGFDQAILSAAGQREEAQKAVTTKGNKGAAGAKGKPLDLSEEITAQQDAWKKANPGAEVNEDYWTKVRNSATHVAQQNPDLTPNEAVDSAMNLITTKGKKPEPDFNTTAGEDGNTIKFKNGRTIKLDDNKFDEIMNHRAANIRAQQEGEVKAKADQDASDQRWGRIKGGVSRAAGAVADDARQFGREVMGAIPDEMRERVKNAPQEIKQGMDRFAQSVGPMDGSGVNYGTLTTAIGKGVQSALETLRNAAKSPQPQQQPQQPGAIPDEQYTPNLTGP